MSEKTQIIVENVFVHEAERKVFNQPELKDVEFIYKGEVVEIDPEEIDFWTHTGLNNIDFITMRMWDDIVDTPEDDYRDPCPKDLDDAVNQILVQLTPANISDIKHVNYEDAELCLHGMYIRNQWNLWFESPLSLWFADKGLYHADDMSGVISKAVWMSVNNRGMIDIKKEAESYAEYWREQGQDVKSQFEERCKNKD